jgi:RNA polymerase sigma-70 factor (ECF subfamily)
MKKPSNRPKPRDVARFLIGRMDDPREVFWLLEWEQRDPEVRRWFESLDLDSVLPIQDSKEPGNLSAAEIELIRDRCRDLAESRLAIVAVRHEQIRALWQGSAIDVELVFDLGSRSGVAVERTIVEGTIEPEATDGGIYRLVVPTLPGDVRLLNLTSASLDLSSEEPLLPTEETVFVRWDRSEEDEHVARTAAADYPVSRPPSNLRAQSELPLVLGAATEHERLGDSDALELTPVKHPKKCNSLRIRCPARRRSLAVVVIECDFPGLNSTTVPWRKTVVLTERSYLGAERKAYFTGESKIPLLEGVDLDAVKNDGVLIRARPAKNDDLPGLDCVSASMLLADSDLKPFPLSVGDRGRYQFEVRRDDRPELADGKYVWVARWTQREESRTTEKKSEPDEDVSQLQQGNIIYLIDKYRNDAFKVAMILLSGNSADAEEAVQEALISVWKRRENVRTNFRAWLFTIVQHECIKIIRRREPTYSINAECSNGDGVKDSPPDQPRESKAKTPIQQLLDAEGRALLAMALRKLTKDQRRIWRMHEVDGRTFVDIAEKFGLSYSQVKTRFEKARNSLVLKMGQYIERGREFERAPAATFEAPDGGTISFYRGVGKEEPKLVLRIGKRTRELCLAGLAAAELDQLDAERANRFFAPYRSLGKHPNDPTGPKIDLYWHSALANKSVQVRYRSLKKVVRESADRAQVEAITLEEMVDVLNEMERARRDKRIAKTGSRVGRQRPSSELGDRM